MLIDDRLPPSSGEGPQPVDPNWRLIGWLVAAAVLGVGAGQTSGFVAYLIICATVYAVCRAAVALVDEPFGLREWRQ